MATEATVAQSTGRHHASLSAAASTLSDMSNSPKTRPRLTAPDEKTITRTVALLQAMRAAAAGGDTARLVRLAEDAQDDPVVIGSVAVLFAQEAAWASEQLAGARLAAAQPPQQPIMLSSGEDRGMVVSSQFPPRPGEARG
jgi:hypothetical protein